MWQQQLLLSLRLAAALVSVIVVSGEDASSSSYGGECHYTSTSDSTPLSQLTPNQFHKICPRQRSFAAFGQPMCGDGTTFNFYASRPTQKYDNTNKLLIEFVGGGACWDAETCGMQSSYLTFPEKFDDFVGLSCSEIDYGTQVQDGFPITMLCARYIGETDFSQYNTIVVPYCTQDVHIGSNTMTYDDGSMVYHRGGHNMVSVLRWVFSNFKNPTNIVLTGCSAGGTALTIAYGLIDKHYNRFGARSTQIDVIADSPVFLTPSYFLNHAFDNWNPSAMMQKIGFNFRKWRTSEEYPVQIWNHVLRRGSNRDRWGFVSHTADEISLSYFQWMSGNGEGGESRGRRLNDNDMSSQWYSELTQSIQSIQAKHKNVADYWMDSDGHCSFGLYYPLQEDGFETWAADIVKERRIVRMTPAVPLFLTSLVVGAGLVAGAYHASRKRQIIHVNYFEFLDESTKRSSRRFLSLCSRFAEWFEPFSVTFAFICATSLYFAAMITTQGFAHPLNNPSLGPSAIGLSGFGINNPSLVVYELQIYRLLTSMFLCSGVLTYLIVMCCLVFVARPMEKLMANHLRFGLAALLIALGSNLLYALVGNGASCSSVGLVLGLNAAYIILRKRAEGATSWGVIISTFLLFGLVAIVFPFNSWIVLLVSVVIGILISPRVVAVGDGPIPADGLQGPEVIPEAATLQWKIHLGRWRVAFLVIVCAIVFLVVLLRIRKPDRLYVQPFYTGCSLMFVQGEYISSFVEGYEGDEDHRGLKEDGFDYENMCAEICVPNIAARVSQHAAHNYFGVPITGGTCEETGYDEHIADKTFEFFSYSLDVEIFQTSDDNDRD